MRRHFLLALLIAGFGSHTSAQEAGSPGPAPVAAVEADEIRGKPDQDLAHVKNARYFVWHDSNGWHLRTASRALTKYSGSIRVDGGSFGKLRPVGLEAKAKNPDRWGVNGDRTEVRFEIHTSGSFDGFDFDIRGGGETSRVVFDLKLGQQGKNTPQRIYLGRKGRHPRLARFECRAAPGSTIGESVNEPD